VAVSKQNKEMSINQTGTLAAGHVACNFSIVIIIVIIVFVIIIIIISKQTTGMLFVKRKLPCAKTYSEVE